MAWSRRLTGYSTGNANDPATLLFPAQPGLLSVYRAVIYCHQYATSGTWDFNAIDPTVPNTAKLLRAIADAGYPVFSPNTEGSSWGNATSATRLGEAITYVQGTLGCRSGTVFLIGSSLGHVVQCNYAKANAANVAAIVGILPLNDMQDLISNNRGAYGSAASLGAQTGLIKAAYTANDVTATCTTNATSTVTCATAASAWVGRQVIGQDMPANAIVNSVVVNTSFTITVGGTLTAASGSHTGITLTIGGFYNAGFGATYNPANYASATTLPMPQQLFYATDDTVCVPSTVTAFQTAIGSSICSIGGSFTGGHTDAAIANVNVATLLAFLAAHN